MAGFKEETVEPAWIFAEDVEAAWLAGCNARDGGGAVQSVRPSKLPPIFKRRSEGKGERNGAAAGGDGGGEMNRSQHPTAAYTDQHSSVQRHK